MGTQPELGREAARVADDERRLMDAYRRGDRSVSDRLFRSFAPQIERSFIRLFGDPELAKGLSQTTAAAVHAASPQYRVGMPSRLWVLTIAARVGIDERHRRERLAAEAPSGASPVPADLLPVPAERTTRARA